MTTSRFLYPLFITVLFAAILTYSSFLFSTQLDAVKTERLARAETNKSHSRQMEFVAILQNEILKNIRESQHQSNAGRYEVHYAGIEQYSNSFISYRLDRDTGEYLRLSFSSMTEKTDAGRVIPAYQKIDVINLLTGERFFTVDSVMLESVQKAITTPTP